MTPELLAKTDPEAKAGVADAALEAIPIGTEAGSEFLAEGTSEKVKDAGAFLEGFYWSSTMSASASGSTHTVTPQLYSGSGKREREITDQVHA